MGNLKIILNQPYSLSQKQPARKFVLEQNLHWAASLEDILTSKSKNSYSELVSKRLESDLDRLHFSVPRRLPGCQVHLEPLEHNAYTKLDFIKPVTSTQFDLVLNHIRGYQLYEVLSDRKKGSVRSRVVSLAEAIKAILSKGRDLFCRNDHMEINRLLRELHSLIHLIHSKHKQVLRFIIGVNAINRITGYRTYHPKPDHFARLHIPEYSDCEDELLNTEIKTVIKQFFTTNLLYSCIKQVIYWRNSMPLQFLLKTD